MVLLSQMLILDVSLIEHALKLQDFVDQFFIASLDYRWQINESVRTDTALAHFWL